MLLSQRSCCRRLSPFLQLLIVLGSLVRAELPQKPPVGESSHSGTELFESDSASGNQLQDEACLLQQFIDVADRRERRLGGQQEGSAALSDMATASPIVERERAIEKAMLELNAALHNQQVDLIGNQTAAQDELAGERDERPLTTREVFHPQDELRAERDVRPLTAKEVLVKPKRRADMESQRKDGGAAEQTGSDAFAHANDSPLNLLLYNEIVFEVSRQDETVAKKSKIALALLEGFFLPALCGVDRCYMGQPILGVLKGLSLGGCLVWYFIDLVAICINMIRQKDDIDTLGLVAHFGNTQVSTALIITICFLIVHCCCICGCCVGGGKMLLGMNITPVRGTDEVVEVEKHQEIRCNYKTVTGTEGIIFGDHNHIEGGWHQVVGNCNVVEGKGCYVKGDANLVNGISNQVEGKGNDVNGMSNVVSGAHNKVSGANPRCTETEPFKQDKFDNYQALRVVDRRQDPGVESHAPMVYNQSIPGSQ